MIWYYLSLTLDYTFQVAGNPEHILNYPFHLLSSACPIKDHRPVKPMASNIGGVHSGQATNLLQDQHRGTVQPI